MENYYKASQLRYLIYWCDPKYIAKWKNLEVSQLNIPLQTLLGDKNKYSQQKEHLNSLTRISLSIWFEECRKLKLENQIKSLRWIQYDTDFKPSQIDKRFKFWTLRGITAYTLISKTGEMDSFQTLKDKYDLDKQDFFRYLQVRTYFNCKIKTNSSSDLIDIMMEAYKSKINRKLIARFYRCLQSYDKNSTFYIKTKWEKEAKITISEDDWMKIWKTQMNTTNSGLWREFMWKNVIRFFITPKIKRRQTARPREGRCWRKCGETLANHFHIFWECPAIQSYWLEVVENINLIMGYRIKNDFRTIYLGDISNFTKTNDRYLIKILLVASKKALTRRWLSEDPPTKNEWIGIVKDIYNMEKITFSLNLNMDKFDSCWKKWENVHCGLNSGM